MFQHNPNAKYEPNGGRFLQKITRKDLYKQKIVVRAKDSDSFGADDYFMANFPNIFTNYMMGAMKIESPLYQNWLHHPMKLWQTQLNFAVFCASSACGVSSAHLNYKKQALVRSFYRFHVYYHIRRILKRLQVVLPYEANFNISDNPYTESEFYNLCHEYNVPSDPMRYRFEKFYGSYQTGGWEDYINPDSMGRFIIPSSNGFNDIGLVRISESIRAYVYLILTSQASARARIVGTTANALTAQQIYLNNFEEIVSRRVDLQSDIKRFQNTLNYASSKVDYSVGEGLYMLPSDMNLRIKRDVVGYNNEILISTGLTLGTNAKVNLGSHKTEGKIPKIQPPKHSKVQPYSVHKGEPIMDYKITSRKLPKVHDPKPHIDPIEITPEEEKIALILFLVSGFAIWEIFRSTHAK